MAPQKQKHNISYFDSDKGELQKQMSKGSGKKNKK